MDEPRSWYVYGNASIAFVSDRIPVKPGEFALMPQFISAFIIIDGYNQ
jgi:hypothetical protein